MHNKSINQKGFMALMSAIIISAVLFLVVIDLNFSGIYSRFNVLDFELKEKSFALAQACVDTAISNIKNNINYIGEITVDSDKCNILPVSGYNPTTINVNSNLKNYITNLEVKIDSDMKVISFIEIP